MAKEIIKAEVLESYWVTTDQPIGSGYLEEKRKVVYLRMSEIVKISEYGPEGLIVFKLANGDVIETTHKMSECTELLKEFLGEKVFDLSIKHEGV